MEIGKEHSVVSGTLSTIDHQKISYQHFKNGCHAVIIIAHGYYNSKQCVVLQQLAQAAESAAEVQAALAPPPEAVAPVAPEPAPGAAAAPGMSANASPEGAQPDGAAAPLEGGTPHADA